MEFMNSARVFLFAAILSGMCSSAMAQLPPVFAGERSEQTRKDPMVRRYIPPVRIVWCSDSSGTLVKNSRAILTPGTGQADLNGGTYLKLSSRGGIRPGLVLDFGRELQGGVEIVTTINNAKTMGRVRIRFGESVAEAMSDIGVKGATNDHAMRDFVVQLPWLGKIEAGTTGFRFVRIDLADDDVDIEIKEISAAFTFRDIPYLGSFRCSDERLNAIWMTGAYTVHLNMQDFLWDGIKRDRLVWVGDMHPEVMTINAVFGHNDVVPKSLDLARDLTPLPKWMNGLGSYSMWWVLIHRDWYLYHGDIRYLREQREYLTGLLSLLMTRIDSSGSERLDDGRFLDWPSSENKPAIHAGLQSLMVMTFAAGAELCMALGDSAMAVRCTDAVGKLSQHVPDVNGSKQAAALLALSGLVPAERANVEILSKTGTHGMSTFYGYYMLQARARAGDHRGAIDNIREYWGGMLDLGATTFWEDFDIAWKDGATRIDQLVPEGGRDVHGERGAYCYEGYRHSLCHGWASGPTSWLTEHVLGITVTEPGCRTITVAPHLGDLEWAEGSFPTPLGVVTVKHTKQPDGSVHTEHTAPPGIRVIRK